MFKELEFLKTKLSQASCCFYSKCFTESLGAQNIFANNNNDNIRELNVQIYVNLAFPNYSQ